MYKSTMEAQTTVIIPSDTCEEVPMPQRHHSHHHSSQQQQQLGSARPSRVATSEKQVQLGGTGSGSDSAVVSADVLSQVAALQLQPPSNGSASADSSLTKAASGRQSWRVEIGSLQNCLRMFGAAPSPYLHAAQSNFVAAARLLPCLAKIQQDLILVASELKPASVTSP